MKERRLLFMFFNKKSFLKSVAVLGMLIMMSACASKDLFYTARPDITITIYPPSNIERTLKNYNDAQYLYYYSDSELQKIILNSVGYWTDSLGYQVRMQYVGEPTYDDSSDYVVRISEYQLKEQKFSKSVSQPATTNNPKMSASVPVRQVNVSFTADIHSNVDGTNKKVTSFAAREENITAGYFQPVTPLFGNGNTTNTNYKYICDIIPLPKQVSEYISETGVNILVNHIDHQIRKDYRTKLRMEKRRQKQLMRESSQ